MNTNKMIQWSIEKKFLKKMKSLLLYFVEFEKDGKLFPKEYLSNCAIENPD